MTQPDTITQANYTNCLQALLEYIQKLKYLECWYGMTNNDLAAGAGYTNSNCIDAKKLADDEWLAVGSVHLDPDIGHRELPRTQLYRRLHKGRR